MRHRKRVVGEHEARVLRDTQTQFRELFGDVAYLERELAILSLPIVEWKSVRLRTIRCTGDFGKGPHDYNVPESVLWDLINLDRFRCAYHRP